MCLLEPGTFGCSGTVQVESELDYSSALSLCHAGIERPLDRITSAQCNCCGNKKSPHLYLGNLADEPEVASWISEARVDGRLDTEEEKVESKWKL